MFTSSKRSSQDNGQDSKRLKLISIPQQFSWTGLSRDQTRTPKKENGTTLTMEGLLLWNVLGYALGDTKDYACFAAVNKEWNQVVKTLEPPVMFKMKEALNRDGLLSTEDLALLDSALHMLEISDSSLYRKDKDGGKGKWPNLQPQFSMILMRFVYQACTQRSPFNFSRNVHELVGNFIQSLSSKTSQKLIQALNKNRVTPGEKLEELLVIWKEWDGLVHVVEGVAGYLDRYYVKHHGLDEIAKHAQSGLVSQLLAAPSLGPNLESLLKPVHSNIQKVPEDLLVRAYIESKAILGFPPSATRLWEGVEGKDQIHEVYSQLKVEMEERLLAQQKPASQPTANGKGDSEEQEARGITIFFPNGTKLEAPSHFVESSGLLKHLHLCPGDAIRWDTDADMTSFNNALEVYALDEQTPMPAIVTPLRSSSLEDLVGPQYARLTESWNHGVLFEVISFCNFLDLKKLLDLSVLAVSLRTRNMTAAQLREIFTVDATVG